MFNWWFTFLEWLKSFFWKEEMEVTLVGLQNSGKTTLVNVLTNGQFAEDMIPTVGFNMRKLSKGRVTLKIWDIGGQPRFRSMWERYCRGVHAIVFVVDAADPGKFETVRAELRSLLARPSLAGIPVLVLGNKNDLAAAVGADQLIERLDLSTINTQEVSCYSISAKNQTNLDITLQWLIKHAKTPITTKPLPANPILSSTTISSSNDANGVSASNGAVVPPKKASFIKSDEPVPEQPVKKNEPDTTVENVNVIGTEEDPVVNKEKPANVEEQDTIDEERKLDEEDIAIEAA